MKKVFLLLLLVISIAASAQVKISQLPTHTGDPSGGYVPITIGAVTKKIDARYFGFGKVDSSVFRNDSLFNYKNGVAAFVGKVVNDGNGYTNSFAFDTASGDIAIGRNGMSAIVVNLDGRYLLKDGLGANPPLLFNPLTGRFDVDTNSIYGLVNRARIYKALDSVANIGIKNQNASAQTGNFWIDGNGHAFTFNADLGIFFPYLLGGASAQTSNGLWYGNADITNLSGYNKIIFWSAGDDVMSISGGLSGSIDFRTRLMFPKAYGAVSAYSSGGYKIPVINSTTDFLEWVPKDSLGGNPVGNFGNIQLNRNGIFATPDGDSLKYDATNGLQVKHNIKGLGFFSNGGKISLSEAGGNANLDLINSSGVSAFTMDASTGTFRLAQTSAPSAPASAFGYLYHKSTDHHVYWRNSTGDYDLTSGGSSSIATSTDANISSPANNQLLKYSTADNKWHNTILSASDIPALSESQITNLVADLAKKQDTGQVSTIYVTGGALFNPNDSTLSTYIVSEGDTGVVTPAMKAGWDAKQTAIQYKDEGSNIGTSGAVNSVNFTGAGVTASESGGAVTVNIPGGSGSSESADFTKATYYAVPNIGITNVHVKGFGNGVLSNINGTATARSIANTSIQTALPRVGYVTAGAAVNERSGFRVTNPFWIGNAAGLGGFDIVAKVSFPQIVTNRTIYFGMIATLAGYSGAVQPSTATNMIGIGVDSTDTNWQLMTNDGSGAATKTDTGIPVSTTDINSLRISIPSNGTTFTVTFTTSSGGSYSTSVSSNIPANDQFLTFFVQNQTNGAVQVVSTDFYGLYAETPFNF